MHLIRKVSKGKIHISHFMHMVSAYVASPKMCQQLAEDILSAVEESKTSGKLIVVDQDSADHIFVVSPTGDVSLYSRMGSYEICDTP